MKGIPSLSRRQLLKSLSMEAGGGAEVTLQLTVASEVLPLIRQQCFVRQIADKQKSMITMTRPLLRIPKLVRAQGAYAVKPGQPAPEFRARFDSVELRPEKIMAFMPIEQEVFEDSTISNIEGMLKAEIAREFTQAEEVAFLLGDKDVDHGLGDPRNVFDGLFKMAAATPYTYDPDLGVSDGTGTSPLVSNIIRALRFLGIYGRNKRDVTVMVGLTAEESLLRDRAFQTMNTYAFSANAGIFTGEIGRLAGATVIATTFLDAVPGSPYGKCLIVNNSALVIGDWQAFSVRVYNELFAQTDQVAIRARERIALAARYPEAITQILNFPSEP